MRESFTLAKDCILKEMETYEDDITEPKSHWPKDLKELDTALAFFEEVERVWPLLLTDVLANQVK